MFLVHDLLEQSARRFPRKTALVCGAEERTYSRLNREANRLANLLRAQGISRGDRVGIYLEKSVEKVAAIFAVSKIGAVFVVLNRALKAPQIAHVVGDCGVKALVMTADRLPLLDESPEIAGRLSFILVAGPAAPAPPGRARVVPYADARKASAADPGCPVFETDLACVIYTSGSTGKPKGVMLTHQNVVLSAHSAAEQLGNDARDVILCVLPLSFDYGLVQVTSCFKAGGTLVLLRYLFANDVLETARRVRATGLAGIPTILIPLCEAAAAAKRLPALRYLTNSGGRLPVVHVRRLRKLFPRTKLFLMYGMTEAFRSTYLDPSEVDRRPDSIGKAVPLAEVHVVDDEGRECAPGQVGELIHRGPLVSKGYWNRPEDTAAKIRLNPLVTGYADPVCYSGDLVRRDEEGYHYFVGRRDSMIKCSGYRVSPTEVEECLYRHPAVAEAAVLGVPDDLLGQKIKAVVSFKAGPRPDEAGLIDHCRQSLPAYSVPQIVRVLERLPKTPNGKIDRPALAEA